jgi:hypothetical protein
MRFTAPAPTTIDLPLLRTEIETATGLTVVQGGRDGADLWVEFDTTEGVDDIALGVTVRQTVAAHSPQEVTDLDALVAKAVNVWAGTDTFTVAQSQKILAGLVLIVARHLR